MPIVTAAGLAAAAAVGLTAGAAASGLMFNYTKNEYEQKITELEGLIAALEDHLVEMRALKEQIPQFWDDENAREVSWDSVAKIGETERNMETGKTYLRTLRTVVSELDGSKGLMADTIEDLKALTSLGIKG